jgi:hypothetical protein
MGRFLQCCGSGMFIPDPDFCPSRIQKQQQKKGMKKIFFTFCSHKYYKIENYFIFKLVKIKIWTNLQRIIELFNQKIVNIGLGSGIRKKPIPDPGSRGQKGTGS